MHLDNVLLGTIDGIILLLDYRDRYALFYEGVWFEGGTYMDLINSLGGIARTKIDDTDLSSWILHKLKQAY